MYTDWERRAKGGWGEGSICVAWSNRIFFRDFQEDRFADPPPQLAKGTRDFLQHDNR